MLSQNRFYGVFLASNAQHIYTGMTNSWSAAYIHRIGIALLAFVVELLAMGVTIEGAIEACTSEQVGPQGATRCTGSAWVVSLVVKPKGDVVKQEAVVGFAESATTDFLLQKADLVLTESREIVQSIINPSAIGLILAAIEHHKARATPRESMISFSARPFHQAGHARGVSIANLMVAANENQGALLPMKGNDKRLHHADGLVSVGRLTEAVAIEENEVGLDAIYTSSHTIDNCLNPMQVIQNDCSKVHHRISRQGEAVKGRGDAAPEGLMVGLILGNLLRTDSIIIGLTRLQTTQADAMLLVVNYLLTAAQLTKTLGVHTIYAYFDPRVDTATRLIHHGDTIRGHILQIR